MASPDDSSPARTWRSDALGASVTSVNTSLPFPLALLFAVAIVGCESKPAEVVAAPGPGSASSDATASGPSASATADPSGSSSPLAVGDPAPDVALVLHDGRQVSLRSLRGKQAVVYFYPKDDTPGCRVEAQGIRDRWKDFQAAGIEVFGVSLQDAASHQAFIDKESLPFPLVVDTDGAVAEAFRVPVKGEYAKRQTFLIGRDGNIARVWLNVSPKGHADELLEAAAAQ